MVVIDAINRILKRDTFLMQSVPAIVVFLVLIVFALASWQGASRSLDSQREKEIDQRISLAEDRLEERLQTSRTLLRAGNGLLYGSEQVNRDEWQRFYKQLVGDEQYIGASVVGYAPVISMTERAEFESSMAAAGYPGGITTSGEASIMVPVQYATAFDGVVDTTYRYDMYSNARYRVALDAARDSGKISMSIATPLNAEGEMGVVMVMPVYALDRPTETVPQRQNALVGYVFEAVKLKELFSKLANEKEPLFGYVVHRVHDEGDTTELYQSVTMRYFDSTQKPVGQSEFNEYGRNWRISYYASNAIVSAGERNRPLNTLIIWVGLAVAASVLVYMMIKYRTRMFALAEEQKLQQAKDELLSLASHQLRTPATGVKQYVGMVLDGFGGPVPPDQSKLLEQAYKSNERQLQIINDFLYVAKIGSGSLTTTRHKFDIAPLVRDVVEEMKLEIKEKRHKIKLKVPKSVPIKADEHSIRMIIENLLSNAIKYTQTGGKIEVELRQGTREVFVSITDNGVGISKKDEKMLFKQFSRIPNELTNEVSGSGIGLYLAQQLAVRNGGKLTVDSEPGRGSTFTLSLPNWRVKKITMPKRNA